VVRCDQALSLSAPNQLVTARVATLAGTYRACAVDDAGNVHLEWSGIARLDHLYQNLAARVDRAYQVST